MQSEKKFEDIRPYFDSEIQEVFERLVKDPGFIYMLKKIKTKAEIQEEFSRLKNIGSIEEFQRQHIAPYVKRITQATIDELTCSGIENTDANKTYLFLSNHRDIILDSALLNNIFTEYGIPTSEIGLGDNLLAYDWIKDLVKLNRGFIVKRSLQGRQMLQASVVLSEYIYRNIAENKRSVWLAQRPGRTKDGHDITHPGLIKMLILNDRKNAEKILNNLNLSPVCISYENEPCEESKILTAYHIEKNIPYQKSVEEDLKSMGRGLLYKKGRVHIHISQPIDFTGRLSGISGDNEITAAAAKIIDKRIYAGYQFFPKNYAAYDLLNKTDKYRKLRKYQPKETRKISEKASAIAQHINKDTEVVKHIYLRMYAAPLMNQEKHSI